MVVNKTRVIGTAFVIICFCFLTWLIVELWRGDTSRLQKVSTPAPKEQYISEDSKKQSVFITEEDKELINSHAKKKNSQKRRYQKPVIKYKAGQIIDLGDSTSSYQKANTIGTFVRARLITAVDTREQGQIVKAMIVDKSISFLPYKTLIFGQASLGQSKRALINFDHALLPTGTEYTLKAQAMSTKTNTLGVDGDFHGKMGLRAATTVGLTVLSGMGEVLTEKESFGGFQGNIVAKPSLKNATYNGLSKAAESEAQRQAERMNEEPEYMIVQQGTEFNLQLLGKIEGAETE